MFTVLALAESPTSIPPMTRERRDLRAGRAASDHRLCSLRRGTHDERASGVRNPESRLTSE
jgi:hypothetical protein